MGRSSGASRMYARQTPFRMHSCRPMLPRRWSEPRGESARHTLSPSRLTSFLAILDRLRIDSMTTIPRLEMLKTLVAVLAPEEARTAGGDLRVREAHRESVRVALDELQRYTQARIGNIHAPETTGELIAATFEHDTARPVDGYAAPQLHTHAVIFNVTERDNGQARALQERSLFQSQRYVTSVYRSELAMRLQKLGYEIETGKHGQPEIRGYTQEYLDASSPRREQIKEHLQEIGRDGTGAAQVAAHRTRDKKEIQSQEMVLQRHRDLSAQFGHQSDRVVAQARERIHQHKQPEKTAQQAATYARDHVFERSAVQDERAILQSMLDRGMGQLSYGDARREFAHRVAAGEFRSLVHREGHAAPQYTTTEMVRMEKEIIGYMQAGSVRGIDYLLATRRLPFRKIGGRVLIPVSELRKYAQGDIQSASSPDGQISVRIEPNSRG